MRHPSCAFCSAPSAIKQRLSFVLIPGLIDSQLRLNQVSRPNPLYSLVSDHLLEAQDRVYRSAGPHDWLSRDPGIHLMVALMCLRCLSILHSLAFSLFL
jgi:hypothetical protein